jgi:hypothetical protein
MATGIAPLPLPIHNLLNLIMLKHYVYRTGQIPTSVHPFVKKEELSRAQSPPRGSQVVAQLKSHLLSVWQAVSQSK